MPSAKSKLSISTLSYVILYVKDMAKSTAFYRDILGMKVKMDSPGWVELDTGTTTLALHAIETKQARVIEGNPELVFQVDNVYQAHEELKIAGVKFSSDPRQVCEEGDNVGFSATFCDYDDNHLSIFSYIPKSKIVS